MMEKLIQTVGSAEYCTEAGQLGFEARHDLTDGES